MIAVNPLSGARRAMRHRHYRNYTIGSVTSLVGTWVQRVALGWLTWELTHSYAWLGIIAFADLFAMMIFAPLAGDLADRMDRLKLSIWSQFAMLWQAVALAVTYYVGWANIWVVLALTIVLGIMHSYHSSSRLALVPNLVPHEDLTPAIAINSMIFNIARFIGPAVAGFVIVKFGVGPAFIINVASFVVFLVMLLGIRALRIEQTSAKPGGMLANIAEGLRYAVYHPGIGPMLLVLAVTSFTGRALPDLLPGFADGVFHMGKEGLAYMASAMGLGATLSGFYWLTRDGIRGMTAVVFVNVVLLSISGVAFVLVGTFWAAVALLVVAGFAMNNSSIGTLNLMQNAVDGHMRGRVMSIFTVIQQGGPAAGTLALGAVAEYTGIAWPVGVAAAAGLALWLAMRSTIPAICGALEIEAPGGPGAEKAAS